MRPHHRPIRSSALFLLGTVFAACAGSPTVVAPPLPLAPAPAPEAPPTNWPADDLNQDGVPGTSSARALRDLLADRAPARTVVVAVIDGGVDTAHVDLRDALFRNPDETPGNGRDDDGNGLVDDVRGWGYLGGPDGRNVRHETLEVTRLYARCRDGRPVPRYECDAITAAFREKQTEVEQMVGMVAQIQGALNAITPPLRQATGVEELTLEAVRGLETADPSLAQARQIWLQLAEAGIDQDYMQEVEVDVAAQAEYNLDPDFDPRPVVGDDPDDATERAYGNPDVMGPDASHGTHVAGIIAAARNGLGMDGIAAPDVRILSIRAVPDGDERDKDVANAIRYAVDQGADLINMSFGKAFSPRKDVVDAAIRYADERGVLMIHAAGNDGADLDAVDNYPTPFYDDGGRAANWITVGASGWTLETLAADFSNYGRTTVDVFAPGVDVLSTVPGGEWERQDGTSMAAPVVSGVAALLMAYFPDLGATDVRRILLEAAVDHGDRMVTRPGSDEPVRFGTLSVTGGVVNAYEAVRQALTEEGR